jgi:hypothetical protein
MSTVEQLRETNSHSLASSLPLPARRQSALTSLFRLEAKKIVFIFVRRRYATM